MNSAKASTTANTVFSLVASAFIMVMLINLSIAFATNEQFFKKYQAFDLKYALHAMEAVPGNAVITYPKNTSAYVYSFKGDKLMVRSPELESGRETGVAYFAVRQALDKVLTKPGSLVFTKVGGAILIGQEQAADLNTLDCQKAEYRKGTLKISHDGPSKDAAENIARLSPFPVTSTTIENADMELRLEQGSYPEDKNPVKVYYSSDAEKWIACNIANSLARDFKVTGYSIIPGDSFKVVYGNTNIAGNPLHEPSALSASVIEALRSS